MTLKEHSGTFYLDRLNMLSYKTKQGWLEGKANEAVALGPGFWRYHIRPKKIIRVKEPFCGLAIIFLGLFMFQVLQREVTDEKGYYLKKFSTIECFPSVYSPPLTTHHSIRFFH